MSLRIIDRIYTPKKSGINMRLYVMMDNMSRIPYRKLSFLSENKENTYITAFNNKYHLECLKHYSAHPSVVTEISLSDILEYSKNTHNNILIIDNMYCDVNKKNTLIKAVSIDYGFNIKHHLIDYKP